MRSGGKRRLPPWLKSSRVVRDVVVELGGLVDHTKREWLGNSEISWGSGKASFGKPGEIEIQKRRYMGNQWHDGFKRQNETIVLLRFLGTDTEEHPSLYTPLQV